MTAESMPHWGMNGQDFLVWSLKLHVALFHDKDMPAGNEPCTDDNCAGAMYYKDHPEDWDDLTTDQVSLWARGKLDSGHAHHHSDCDEAH